MYWIVSFCIAVNFAIVFSSVDLSKAATTLSQIISPSRSSQRMPRTPVLCISHGGPNLVEDSDHPAYKQLQKLGREITQDIRPKAIVVISAHWAGEPNQVEVNTAVTQGLIYDFYGFPAHYYKWQFPHSGSPELATRVLSLLGASGIKAEGVRRGLDHGVWVPFWCTFNPEENALPADVPIVQVSLFDSDDGAKHFALGEALTPLRDEGVLIIGSGMAVHNLRDMFRANGLGKTMPYVESFEPALKEAMEMGSPELRKTGLEALLRRPDARKAHPDFDHLLPFFVGAGAAGEDPGKMIFTSPQGSLSWGMFQYGVDTVAAK